MSELDSSLEAYASINATDISHTDESALLTENETEHDAVIEADTDPELIAIKARVKEMEAEAEKLKAMQTDVEKQMTLSPTPSAGTAAVSTFPTIEERKEADTRSVYVGNVDYAANAEELENHFHGAGPVNRVTILCDKYSGHPKGFAYIEFTEPEAVSAATALDGTLFRGRQLQVSMKRTNEHGFNVGSYGGGGGRGRGRYRGGYRSRPRYNPYGGRGRRFSRGRGSYRGSYYSGY